MNEIAATVLLLKGQRASMLAFVHCDHKTEMLRTPSTLTLVRCAPVDPENSFSTSRQTFFYSNAQKGDE